MWHYDFRQHGAFLKLLLKHKYLIFLLLVVKEKKKQSSTALCPLCSLQRKKWPTVDCKNLTYPCFSCSCCSFYTLCTGARSNLSALLRPGRAAWICTNREWSYSHMGNDVFSVIQIEKKKNVDSTSVVSYFFSSFILTKDITVQLLVRVEKLEEIMWPGLLLLLLFLHRFKL